MSSTTINRDIIEKYEALTERLAEIRRYEAAYFFKPNPFQKDFFKAGAWADERLLSCGNQSGKTLCGGIELAFHLTGRYPDWWEGRRFDHPIRALVVGITFTQMRDSCQRVLMYSDTSREPGTGAIPRGHIGQYQIKKDGDGAYDYICVKHVSGDDSYVKFVTQGMPWENIMGDRVDVVWGDEALEEPRYYDQLLARIAATNGIIYVTCTPEHGYSYLYQRYEVEKPKGSYIRYGSLYETTHLTPKQVDKIVERYPPHVRPYRVYGKPFAGAGMVIPVNPKKIVHKAFEIPNHYRRISGIDFGYSESLTAIVWIAIDPNTNTYYIYDRFATKQATPEQIVPEILRRDRAAGFSIPMAWPRDGSFAERSTGIRIAHLYRNLGVNMLPEAAYFVGADGKKTCSVEAGVQEILQLIHTNQFYVMVQILPDETDYDAVDPVMQPIFNEMRVWGRDDEGRIKKTPSTDPHHWDAIRYALGMSEMYAMAPMDDMEGAAQFSLHWDLMGL